MAEQHTASRQTILIRLTVNGHGHEVAVEPHETLIELIRDHLGLTGTKKSCDMQRLHGIARWPPGEFVHAARLRSPQCLSAHD